jgi:hypothetical protein
MREAFVARQSGKAAILAAVYVPSRFLSRVRKFNFDSPMLDSTALWLKSNKQKSAAILLHG